MRKAMLLLAVFGLLGLAWAADDPFIGTWKLDVAKSKVPNPSMLPKSETITNEGLDNGLKSTYGGVDAAGKAYHMVWSGKYDGKDYPIMGSPDWDTCAEKKINTNTLVIVNKKAGKEVSSTRCTVSKNGKTGECIGKAKDEKGQEVTSIYIYDKQ